MEKVKRKGKKYDIENGFDGEDKLFSDSHLCCRQPPFFFVVCLEFIILEAAMKTRLDA